MRWSRWLLVAACVCLAGSAAAQLSPGALSEAHAALDGSRGCFACHAPGQGVSAERCLDCHGALGARIAAGEGLHADPAYRRCETCHIEHHGREFELIDWGAGGRDAFDHRKTSYALVGAHAEAACRDCHRPQHVDDPAALMAAGSNPRTTFLGLQPACLGCHRDEHRGQLDRASTTGCLDCHVHDVWSPAPAFDHASTAFPLTGRHERLACGSCHPTGEDGGLATVVGGVDSSFLQLTGVAHQSCSDCHDDPHQGRLGATCASCHTPSGWRQVSTADFDHSRTRFPLRGRHRGLACVSCHGDGDRGEGASRRGLEFASCADCHVDPHRGRLGATCASCHEPSSWLRVSTAGFDHARTDFPLRGAHRAVACASCHTSGRATRALAHQRCSDCHRDPHRGQLERLGVGTERRAVGCEACHDVDAFVPSSFTVARHQDGPFPLDGAHRAVACVACHTATDAEPVRRFRFGSTTCARCHADPHAGAMTRLVEGAGCDACHSVDDWSRVDLDAAAQAGFDHGSTGFPLAGGHEGLACARCHGGDEGSQPRFAGTPRTCIGCHRDPHFGAVSRQPETALRDPVSCARCHAIAGWRPSSFDHERDAGFALEGAHARLVCAACHVVDAASGPVLRLDGLPTTCAGCHGGEEQAEVRHSSASPVPPVLVTFRSSADR